jgi:hypothetical protein
VRLREKGVASNHILNFERGEKPIAKGREVQG